MTLRVAREPKVSKGAEGSRSPLEGKGAEGSHTPSEGWLSWAPLTLAPLAPLSGSAPLAPLPGVGRWVRQSPEGFGGRAERGATQPPPPGSPARARGCPFPALSDPGGYRPLGRPARGRPGATWAD